MLNKEAVQQILSGVVDPNIGRDLLASRSVKAVEVDAQRVHVRIVLGYPARTQLEPMRKRVVAALQGAPDWPAGAVADVEVDFEIAAHAVQRGVKLIPGVRNIVAIASGKGGVGKSTTAANLALALAAEGARVGVLDADIYGPSQPTMLGITGRPESPDDKSMNPLHGHGLQVNSIGFLIDPDNPMIWRGPMASSALEQLVNQTNWRDLDYLVVDMPPGTGDIQLSLAQKVPVTGAVIVTTPQDIALLDARKGVKTFEKVGVPILGVVENMSVHVCSQCGHVEHIFGSGGGEKMCRDFGIDFLGSLPLDIGIREQADSGLPTVVAQPESPAAELYRGIARRVAVAIAAKQRDMSGKFPSIVVQNT